LPNKEPLTAKTAKKIRKGRKEEHKVLNPFFASFADFLRGLCGYRLFAAFDRFVP
jgi:hypothetical protein